MPTLVLFKGMSHFGISRLLGRYERTISSHFILLNRFSIQCNRTCYSPVSDLRSGHTVDGFHVKVDSRVMSAKVKALSCHQRHLTEHHRASHLLFLTGQIKRCWTWKEYLCWACNLPKQAAKVLRLTNIHFLATTSPWLQDEQVISSASAYHSSASSTAPPTRPST